MTVPDQPPAWASQWGPDPWRPEVAANEWARQSAEPAPDVAWELDEPAPEARAANGSYWGPPPGAWQGHVYTFHLDPPIGAPGADPRNCAGHYTGHAAPGRLAARLHQEATGGPNAAKILQHQMSRPGAQVILADLQPGDYARERQLKKQNIRYRCQLCPPVGKPAADAARWKPEADAGAEHEAEAG